MSKRRAVGLAILAGFGLGIATIQGLGAKDTAPVFLVAEVEVTDLEGYMKEYVPLVQKSLEASGWPASWRRGRTSRPLKAE